MHLGSKLSALGLGLLGQDICAVFKEVSFLAMQAVKMLELVLFMFQKAGGWCGDVNHFVQVLPV